MSKVHTRYMLIKSWVSLILCLGILLGFFNGLLFVKSFLQDAWSIIHQMQMMLLLTLINGNAEYYAGKLILDCSFSAFSIFLFPVEMFKSFPLIRHLYTVEPDQHLLDLGVTTGSTVVSCIFLVLVLSTLVLVHLSALKLFQGQRSDTLKRLIPKMYSRVFIETFIFVMIASMFEIKNYNKNGSSLSIIFTLLILLYEAMFMLIVLLSWKRYSKVKEIDQDSYSSEFYVGIITVSKQRNQDNDPKINNIDDESDDELEDEEPENDIEISFHVKMARLYTFVFLLRRLLMAFIIVIPSESIVNFKIWSLLILQAAYIYYLVKFRCFQRIKNKIYEIVNEIVYLMFMIMFYFMLSKSENSRMEVVVLNVMLFQSIFLFAGSLHTFVSTIINIRKIMSEQNGQANQDDVEIHSFSAIRSNSLDEETKTLNEETKTVD